MKAKEVFLFYFLTFLNGIRHITDNCRVQVLGEKTFFFPAMTDGQTADDYNKKIKKLILENQKDFSLWLLDEIGRKDALLQQLKREVAQQQIEMQRTQLQIGENCRTWERQNYINYTSPYFDNVDYVGTNQMLFESQGIGAEIVAEKTALYNQHMATRTTLQHLSSFVTTNITTILCECKYDRTNKLYVCYISVK